jgi:hypothetical protein
MLVCFHFLHDLTIFCSLDINMAGGFALDGKASAGYHR